MSTDHEGGIIQTSRGAEVPFKAAEVLFKRYQSNPAAINGPGRIDIGNFTVERFDAETGEVKIGCHVVPWSELVRVFS